MLNFAPTIVTLNLWHYTDWTNRLPLIIDLIKKLSPDIILLQEAQRDISYNENDQVTQLRELLDYPFSHFEIACIKTMRKGVLLSHPVEHGLGFISKIDFTTEALPLTQAEGDNEPRILLKADFKVNNEVDVSKSAVTPFTITNVHFANKDKWAEAHLIETLTTFKNRNIKSILAGDFNIKNITEYKNTYEADYNASADLFSYTSYPKDNLSYDHILLPKECSFIDFQCRDEIVSDHKLLCAVIQVKK